ncbi:MAG TPA: YCF48-related protein [Anaerolineae bacterium]|nr:YCF48-related protein [Anaerolineae bacterium]
MTHHFVSGEGALWAQRNGPNTVPVYLGCHQLGDVDQPEGDVELIYCPDATGPSRFKTVGSLQGAAGAITTSVTTDITDELDELERTKCPFTLFVHMSKSGRKDVFTNFDRTYVFVNVRITSRGLTNLTARTPDDNARAEQTFDLSAEELLRLITPTITGQSNSETMAANDITFCNEETCRTSEDPASDICQTGFIACDSALASPSASANVLKTTNGGTWTATAADPFGVQEGISGVECFALSRDETRVLASRGSPVHLEPAQVAYSDDSGANWTIVNVGSVNFSYIATGQSMFAFDRNNIYVGLTNGYIYKSVDAGLSYTAVESATIHAGIWNAIHFADDNVGYAVGAANVVAKTLDAGVSWSSVTGPTAEAGNAAVTVFVQDRNRVWVGYDSGTLYYTLNGGSTWTERAFSGSGVGQVRDIRFFNDSLGFMAVNNASPIGTIHWSIDGGYTWSALTTPTNTGLNRLYICDQWTFFTCGEVQASIAFIAKGAI